MAEETPDTTPDETPEPAAAETPAVEPEVEPAEAAPPAASPPKPPAAPQPQLSAAERKAAARARRGRRRAATPEERAEERRAKAVARSRRRKQEREKRRAAGPREGTPPAERPAGNPQVRLGKVTSDKADKTIVVRIDTSRRHRRYRKIVRSTMTLHAHDERNDANEGDLVRVIETRPMSRSKRWRLVEILERAR